MWDYFLSEPQTQSEHDIRQKLGEELHQLEVYQDRGRAGHPVSRILWARGMRPFVWPDDTPGTMPGEIPLFITGIESDPIRLSIIPVPTVSKREGNPLMVAWVGPRLPFGNGHGRIKKTPTMAYHIPPPGKDGATPQNDILYTHTGEEKTI